MFFEIELTRTVVIAPGKLDNGLRLKRSIILQLMDDLSIMKADEEYGYFVTVNTLEEVGQGKIREMSGSVVFRVKFKCLVFRPLKNEVVLGKVQNVTKFGLLLSCGPIKEVFIHSQYIGDFEFIHGQNPVFKNQDMSIEKGTMLRLRIMSLKWFESHRMFRALGTLAGDYLGPVNESEHTWKVTSLLKTHGHNANIFSDGKTGKSCSIKMDKFTQPLQENFVDLDNDKEVSSESCLVRQDEDVEKTNEPSFEIMKDVGKLSNLSVVCKSGDSFDKGTETDDFDKGTERNVAGDGTIHESVSIPVVDLTVGDSHPLQGVET